jgi:Ca2+-binding RTX toxin-like protein
VNNTGTVFGNTGNDTIVGTSGVDTIHTGGGNDVIIGTAGNDQFYFVHIGPNDSAKLEYAYGDGADTIFGFLQAMTRLISRAWPATRIQR